VTIDLVVTDHRSGQIARLSGHLARGDVAKVRLRLFKCLAEQPSALIVDLTDVTVEDPIALTVFSAVARQAARWPGVPVLLCVPPGPIHSQLAPGTRRGVPIFASVAEATAPGRIHAEAPLTVTDELLPIRGAARLARNIATEACLRWGLEELAPPAALIANELVSNVVEHVLTIATLRITLRSAYLTVSVKDGSTEPPVGAAKPDAGHLGLLLVAATAHSWGWLPTADGKAVWASLAR
jgi:anti-anti-sigma regulatory factor